MSKNRISPFHVQVDNATPRGITVQQAVMGLSAADGTDIALVTMGEPWQAIAKSERKSFLLLPLELLESGRQKVGETRSKPGGDYLNAVLSIKVVVRAGIHDEVVVSRDLPLQIRLDN